MRDDEPDDLPSMRATDDERVGINSAPQTGLEPPVVRAVRESSPRRARTGALWALCLSLLLAVVGLGYWSHEQQNQLKRQLIATQESFSRISEEAADRLQTITGKVSATESTLTGAEQAQRQRLQKIEQALESMQAKLGGQEEQLEALQKSERSIQYAVAEHKGQLAQLNEVTQRVPEQLHQLQAAHDELTNGLGASQQTISELQKQLQRVSAVEQQLVDQATQLDQLGKQLKQQQQAVTELGRNKTNNVEQELLVLRTELEHSTSTINQSLESIDRFRLQTNRAINTLREQLSAMQQ